MTSTSQSRALAAAARRIGGARRLATFVRAPAEAIEQWIAAELAVPELYLERAVEVILADQVELAAWRRAFEAVANAGIELDAASRQVCVRGAPMPLPLTQWAVLESLLCRIGRVVSQGQLAREFAIWTGQPLSKLEMHVFRLRLKLAPASLEIRTAYREGYALELGAAL